MRAARVRGVPTVCGGRKDRPIASGAKLHRSHSSGVCPLVVDFGRFARDLQKKSCRVGSAADHHTDIIAKMLGYTPAMAPLSWGVRADREQLKFELLDIEPTPVFIGRFVVAGKLGAGATGVVLEAYDPELERGVAIKVLRAEVAEESDLQTRLQREAKALARLSHPNVVSVFEVGQHEQHPFVVMELLRGPTLRDWLSQRPRPWREILDVFLAAGLGLSAAHASNLVHRDFKPENLLLTEAGVPKVVDFGLVSPQSETTNPSMSEDRLTAQPVGTPQYMAPEQLSHEPVDARADQYSFCVALHEALTEHVDGSAPPRRLLDAIERGRSAEAADRWPTLDALLAALRSATGQGRAQRRRWGTLLAASTFGVAALAFGLGDGHDDTSCGDPATLRAVWSPDDAAILSERVSGPHTIKRLDAYAARWQQATEQACRTRVGRDTDRRVTCLQHRLVTFDTFVQSLPDTGPLPAVSLPPPEACLESSDSPEPAQAVAETLARARGASDAGDYSATKQLLQHAWDTAQSLKDEPGASDVQNALGHLAEVEGRYEDAIEHYEKGFFAGFQTRRTEAILRSATGAIRIEAQYLANLERAEWWAQVGRHMTEKDSGHRDTQLAFTNASAAIHVLRGRLAEAVELTTSALADAQKLPDPIPAFQLLTMRAGARDRQHDFDGAVDDFRSALVLAKRLYGDTHHATAETYTNLGSVLQKQGDLEGAGTVLEAALKIYLAEFGEKHTDTGLARLNLSAVYSQQGNAAGAAELLDGLPQIFDDALGPNHPWTSVALRNTCVVARELGPSRDAVPTCRRAVEIATHAHGAEHFETAQSMLALAQFLREVGDLTEFEDLVRQVIPIYNRTSASKGAEMQSYLAEFLHSQGRDEEAIEQLQQVAAIRTEDEDFQQIIDDAQVLLRELEGGS